jgi:hypothetical protein
MLSDGDRTWLQGNFDRIHDRINKGESSLYHAKEEMAARLELARKEHEDKYHNPAKTWGIISAIIAALTGLMELAKWLVKKGL